MTPFSHFKNAVQRQFRHLIECGPIFVTDINKDEVWNVYQGAFASDTDPIYRKNREHDCSCCQHFLRAAAGIVGILNGAHVVSLWDFAKEDLGRYRPVAESLAAFAKAAPIQNIFLHDQPGVGVDQNRGLFGEVVTVFDHFHLRLPDSLCAKGAARGERLSEATATFDVLLRGLREITPDALDTVLGLIAQGSLYRGEENARAVEAFRDLKRKFDATAQTCTPAEQVFAWANSAKVPQSIARIRNTAIGTLLTDLSTGVDLDAAVASFESKVAPANYKRPTALVTKGMIEKARTALDALGLLPSLERRFAVLEDIKIPDVLFADRAARKRMRDVFDTIATAAPAKERVLDRVSEISIGDFITNVLPTATALEVLFEHRHAGNLVSLIAPYDLTAKGLFKWPNGFSWSYSGDLADSIKERVKSAGGVVDADLRCSLAWFNFDDLDLHMIEPSGLEIAFWQRSSSSGGELDVDMNAGAGRTRTPVENIRYRTRRIMPLGAYRLQVKQYCQRETCDVGFTVEIEFDGTPHTFHYAGALPVSKTVEVAEIQYSPRDGFKIVKSIPSTINNAPKWGLARQTFHRVQAVTLSPNYWSGHGVGNKHYFFLLDGCRNDGAARGFYNEFLSPELDKHRKVLEIVGAKMRTEKSDEQLSGLGFSSTQRDSLLCKVQGPFARTVKILF